MTVLITHPSPDVYGSDLMLLETVHGLRDVGHDVHVILPQTGPLIRLLTDAGAEVDVLPFLVLRKAVATPRGLLRLLARTPVALLLMVRVILRIRPQVVYVNTVTIPWWIIAARLTRTPVLVHVHEAESTAPRLVRWGMGRPLLWANAVVTNSYASQRALVDIVPRLSSRTAVLYNGVPDPGPLQGQPAPSRLVLVGRLSPRKGIDVALEAVALLRSEGRDVSLDLCGSAYTGYEWYENELRRRAAMPDLAGSVRFLGYVRPTSDALERAEVVLVPSRQEPFGNTAVEGLLSRRPIVASDVQGLAEIIQDGHTGLLVPPDDPAALAAAIAKLLDNPALAEAFARAGREDALARFGVSAYRAAVAALTEELAR